jgi:dihydrodipicolinate synthase/N-acetylneuraminate lyase
MMASFDIVVPALALRAASGSIDYAATRLYAKRAAATWVDYFILSGSTTQGQHLTPAERARVLDLWLDITEPGRLMACCWEPDDFTHATDRGVAPMATMRDLHSYDRAVAFLRALPAGAYIYSHPMFGGAVFDANLAAAARREGVLPAGGKIAKISTAGVTDVHKAAGDTFKLWDGSSRRIKASLDAGAAGVVATPLCAFDADLPPRNWLSSKPRSILSRQC